MAKSSRKVHVDLNGTSLVSGDRVVTIQLNRKAKGGDLVYAYFYQPDDTKAGKLVSDLDRAATLYNTHGMLVSDIRCYSNVDSSKVFKV